MDVTISPLLPKLVRQCMTRCQTYPACQKPTLCDARETSGCDRLRQTDCFTGVLGEACAVLGNCFLTQRHLPQPCAHDRCGLNDRISHDVSTFFTRALKGLLNASTFISSLQKPRLRGTSVFHVVAEKSQARIAMEQQQGPRTLSV